MEKKKRTRRSFSREFKLEAVERSKSIGISATCEELGISSSALTRWRREFLSDAAPADRAGKPSYEELERENRRLKKEIGYIEEINKVLKKSTAIFSNKEMAHFK